MAAPTEWTYDGQLDWSSADSLRLAPVGLVLQTIIEAIKERYAAVGVSPPALLSAEFNPIIALKGGYIDAIQAAITYLMTCDFVKHTDSGGDWTGQTQILVWTEADMLAAIGAEERIVLYPLSVLSAEWCYQQYLMLNLLRWTKIPITDYTLVSEQKQGVATDVETAISRYNSSIWESSISGPRAETSHISGFQIYRTRIKIQNGDTFNTLIKDVDLYFFTAAAGLSGGGYTRVFDSYGESLSEDAYFRLESITGQERYFDSSKWFTEIDTLPTPVEENANTARGWRGYPHAVLKFDVEGGFKFID